MLIASYDIVFQEIPGEVTLALNLSQCPNGCSGCHSAHLQGDVGECLTDELFAGLLDKYGPPATTCVAFMGGDADPDEVNRLAAFVRARSELKTAWYSGRQTLSDAIEVRNFDFVKLGPYVEKLGGLDSPTTNQRFYFIDKKGCFTDKTALFREK